MVTEGEAFDIQNDFTGLKLSEGDHVELKKAAMEDGLCSDYNHVGTYKCVYLVTPASGEAYLVARNITVTPREAETDGSMAVRNRKAAMTNRRQTPSSRP